MNLSEALLSTQGARRRAAGLGVLALAALAVHLLVVSGLEGAWPRPAIGAPAVQTVQVRVVDAAPPAEPPTAVVPLAEAVPAVPAPRPAARPALPRSRPIPAATPSPPAETLAMADVAAPPALAMPVLAVLPVAAAAAPAVEAVAGLDSVPRYRTQLPPAITLRYVMQRGGLRGNGEFSWRPDGDHYELRLEGRVAGLSVLTQVSSGGFDAAGIAPLRFTDTRLRRGTKAANFQRAAGKITFSGPSTEFPLRDGAQDRLSWMVQLGAVVAAEPSLRSVGAKVVLYVVGANGEASVWAFDCTAIEPVSTGAGTVNALKFVREPREPYDTQVQVWIDAAQHYLPVRATQKSGSNDEGFELRLQSVETPP
jgi:hypothetical protein